MAKRRKVQTHFIPHIIKVPQVHTLFYTNTQIPLNGWRKGVLAKVLKYLLFLPDKMINVYLFASPKINLCKPLK
jgi:hypothetical protein